MEAFDGLLRHALFVTGMLCVPILLIATAIGTLVAIVQAATQVQEQTLSLLPKLLAVGFAVAIFGAAGMQMCAALLTDALRALPEIVHAL